MATNTATVINLVNTALGAGMLALPYAFRAQGLFNAAVSILAGALATGLGLMILAYSSGFLPPGSASFFQVSRITYPSLAVLFDVAIALKCFGVSVSYLVIIGDLMPMVTDYFGYATSRITWLVIAMIILTPISFQRSLESLKTASLIALSSVVYLVIIVVWHFVAGDTVDQKGDISWFKPESMSSAVSSVPIIVFAFTCAQNMYSSINEMADKSIKSIFNVTAYTMLISALTYLVVGLAGYLSFGNNVSDNIISMYSLSIWSTLGRFAIVVLVLFSYPLMCNPARASVINVIGDIRQSWRKEDGEAAPLVSHTTNTQPSNKEHVIVTSSLLILSFVVASTMRSLELILSLVGATGATTVSFILPGIFGYALSSTDRENSYVHLSPSQKKLLRIVCIGLVTLGVTIAILAVSVNLRRILQ